ncbi:MAG: hypothetical protein QF384_20365, partial [Alphaproteobacteria bacterium]|nr:hypothetical protein [Alphaproteobacteria bacterium]
MDKLRIAFLPIWNQKIGCYFRVGCRAVFCQVFFNHKFGAGLPAGIRFRSEARTQEMPSIRKPSVFSKILTAS